MTTDNKDPTQIAARSTNATKSNGGTMKKRRVPGACDICKKKKIRCDSGEMPGNRCSHCIQYGLECTHREVTKNLGAAKSYVESLEVRLEKMEKLLNKLAPGIDITQGIDESSESESFELPRSDSPEAPEKLAEKIDKLQLNPPQTRWFGQSSGYQLVQTALDIKCEYTGVNDASKGINASKRPEFWEIPPWRTADPDPKHTAYTFPDHDLIMSLSGAYFQHINPFLPLLHRPTFEAAIARNDHLRDRYFGATVLLVCALGSRYSEDSRTFMDPKEPRSSGWQWFRQVDVFRSSFVQRPNLHELQTYALYVLFAQSSEMPHGVWTQIGLALRMTQEVGAHRRRPRDGSPTAEDELWKRAFWVIVCIDRSASANSGRPLSLQPEDIDVDPPIQCDDEYWDHSDHELNFMQPTGTPSVLTFFTCYIALMDILASAMRAVYSLKKPQFILRNIHRSEQQVLADLDSALNRWMGSLPDHLRWNPSQENTLFLNQSAWLHAMYYHVQIFTHRPFIPSPKKITPSTYPSLAICTNAARSCCHVLEAQSRRNIIPYPHIQTTAFTSGVVLLLSIWTGKRTGHVPYPKREFQDVQKCMDILKACERRWACAGRFWDLLSELASVGEPRRPQPRQAEPEGEDNNLPPPSAHTTPASSEATLVHPHTPKDSLQLQDTSTDVGAPYSCPNFALPMYTNELGRLPVFGHFSFTDFPIEPLQDSSSPRPLNQPADVFMGSEIYPMDGWYRYQSSDVDSLAAAQVSARSPDRQSTTQPELQWDSTLPGISAMDDQTMMMWTSAPTGLDSDDQWFTYITNVDQMMRDQYE